MATKITAPGAGQIANYADMVEHKANFNDDTDESEAIMWVMENYHREMMAELSFVESMAYLNDVTEHYDNGDAYEPDQIDTYQDWRDAIMTSYSWHIVQFSIRNHLRGDYEIGDQQIEIEIEMDPLERFDGFQNDVRAVVAENELPADHPDVWHDAVIEANMESKHAPTALEFVEQMHYLDAISEEYDVGGAADTHVRDSLLSDDWRNGVSMAYASDLTRFALREAVDQFE